MNLKTLGMNIREKRLSMSLTREQLAEIVDISTDFLGKIERGECPASLEVFVRITNALQSTPDTLLGISFEDRGETQIYKKKLFDALMEIVQLEME